MPPVSQYHVFSLPLEFLDTFVPRNLFRQSGNPTPPDPQSVPLLPPTGARSCTVCPGVIFSDVDEQRIHYRSDWHRYNVKIRLAAGSPVTELAFTQLVEALEDSLSGSASSSDESDSDSDKVASLFDKTKRIERSPSPTQQRALPQTALAWFHSPPSTQVGVYKALFSSGISPASFLDELKSFQQMVEHGRHWAVFMTAGGHFAGAIARVSRAQSDGNVEAINLKKKLPKPKADIEVLKHKTFHRYTTRRKQGGSQSVNDSAKGPAKSAGAQLRRYGEQALRDDIRNLLNEWAADIEDCERIWIRASVSNKRIFLDYDGAVIHKGDQRLRTFPFPTRRPTQSELSRCLLELTKVKVSHFTEAELQVQDEAYLASLPKPKPLPAPAAPEIERPKPVKLSKEEELLRTKWARLIEMIIKGRLEALKVFWEREGANMGGVDVPLPEWTGERTGTLLQLAAQNGAEEVTRWLLEDQHADPTIEAPSRGTLEKDDEDSCASDASDAPPRRVGTRKTAYDLARTKQVRNVFRRCAAMYPAWWDWFGAARVPSALSKAMEEEREEKRKSRRKGLKEKIKEREALERERARQRMPTPEVVDIAPKKQETKVQDPTAPRRLGGSSGTSEGLAGLTPEMRAKVERERRARAAEARLKALGGR